jgi:hypothetical protein
LESGGNESAERPTQLPTFQTESASRTSDLGLVDQRTIDAFVINFSRPAKIKYFPRHRAAGSAINQAVAKPQGLKLALQEQNRAAQSTTPI